MKTEDYLWDKTGTDPEIEKLENALAVFRYQDAAPPELTAKVLPFAKKESARPARSFFRYAYAAAACIIFAAATLAVWSLLPKDEIKFVKAPLETTAPLAAVEIPAETAAPTAVPGAATVTATKAPNVDGKQSVRPRVVRIKNTVNKIRPMVRDTKVQTETAALSREEKYAYDQLMLALSITGSKLKLVTDKIDNSENTNTVDSGGK